MRFTTLTADTPPTTASSHREKIAFLVVGGWNTAFSYGVFALLLFIAEPMLGPLATSEGPLLAWIGRHHYLVVQWATWLIAVPQSTMAFRYLVFRRQGSRGSLKGQLVRAYFVYVPLQGLATVMLWFFSGVLGLHPLLGQGLTIGSNAVLSYLGHKHFTFKAPANKISAFPAVSADAGVVSLPATITARQSTLAEEQQDV